MAEEFTAWMLLDAWVLPHPIGEEGDRHHAYRPQFDQEPIRIVAYQSAANERRQFVLLIFSSYLTRDKRFIVLSRR